MNTIRHNTTAHRRSLFSHAASVLKWLRSPGLVAALTASISLIAAVAVAADAPAAK